MTLPTSTDPVLILTGCALTELRKLPSNCIDAIITSPPYWGLRDYGIDPTDWPACSYAPMPGLDPIHVDAETSCLGLEPTLHAFIAHLVLIFEECRRVLKPTGSCWVNMGDGYCSNAGGYDENGSRGETADKAISKGTQSAVVKDKTRMSKLPGLKPKDLIGQPWRVAFALQAAGWYLRQDNIWHKPNPMPESTRDRATKSHEYVFHLTKQERYYFDLTAWAEKASDNTRRSEAAQEFPSQALRDDTGGVRRRQKMPDGWNTGAGSHGSFHPNGREKGATSLRNSFARTTKDSAGEHGQKPQFRPDRDPVDYSGTRNKRSVWTVPTHAFKDAHYATYPPRLITPPLLASTSAYGCCSACGAPWQREVQRTLVPTTKAVRAGVINEHDHQADSQDQGSNRSRAGHRNGMATSTHTLGWLPTCSCDRATTTIIPARVLDIFGGSGTTALVAIEHGRHAILIERGPHNVKLIHQRLAPVLQSPTLALA